MRTYRSLILAGGIAAVMQLSACITHSDAQRVYRYTCTDGYAFTADYSRDEQAVVLTDAEGSRKLKQIRAASGTRYTDGEEYVLVTKGLITRALQKLASA